jgi:hypothetical protein
MGARKLTAFVLVALFHVGLLYFLGSNLRVAFHPEAPEKVPQLIYWEFTKPKSEAKRTVSKSSKSSGANTSQSKSEVTAASVLVTESSTDTAITITNFEAAKDVAVQLALAKYEAESKQRSFSSKDRASMPMPEPIERSPIKWDPLHGKKAGLTDQGVPFIKLSEKCVIVVVFPVCAFGGKIVHDGTLFEDMDNKLDRARENELP